MSRDMMDSRFDGLRKVFVQVGTKNLLGWTRMKSLDPDPLALIIRRKDHFLVP